MDIKRDYAIKEHNTFSIDACCDWFITYDNLDDLKLLSSDEYFRESRVLNIGEGSNMLFLSNFHGILLKSNIKTIDVIEKKANGEVDICVGSGVIWDDFVDFAVDHGFYGIENLSYIPGTVGSSAVQNIGAYGCEVSETIKEVHFFDFVESKDVVIKAEQCNYSYRSSIFKQWEESKTFAIHHVVFTLRNRGSININYPDLTKVFSQRDIEDISLKEVRQAIIEIRKNKLPDPKIMGNAGSFFVNPILDEDKFSALYSMYPQMPFYKLDDGRVKVPAGWLIDKCGLKGYREGNVGTFDRQALVLVNYGGATGREIAAFADKIQQEVKHKFDIDIYPEVKYIL